jgi:hypothetical protein
MADPETLRPRDAQVREAALHGSHAALQRLLGYGADPDAALPGAVARGDVPMMRQLFAAGVSVHAVTAVLDGPGVPESTRSTLRGMLRRRKQTRRTASGDMARFAQFRAWTEEENVSGMWTTHMQMPDRVLGNALRLAIRTRMHESMRFLLGTSAGSRMLGYLHSALMNISGDKYALRAGGALHVAFSELVNPLHLQHILKRTVYVGKRPRLDINSNIVAFLYRCGAALGPERLTAVFQSDPDDQDDVSYSGMCLGWDHMRYIMHAGDGTPVVQQAFMVQCVPFMTGHAAPPSNEIVDTMRQIGVNVAAHGGPALTQCVRKGHTGSVAALLRAGVAVSDDTCVMEAACGSGSIEIIVMLLDAGAHLPDDTDALFPVRQSDTEHNILRTVCLAPGSMSLHAARASLADARGKRDATACDILTRFIARAEAHAGAPAAPRGTKRPREPSILSDMESVDSDHESVQSPEALAAPQPALTWGALSAAQSTVADATAAAAAATGAGWDGGHAIGKGTWSASADSR